MPRTVALPDGREIEFPDDAQDWEITDALKKNFPESFGEKQPFWPGVGKGAAKGAVENIAGAVKGLGTPEGLAQTALATTSPVPFIKSPQQRLLEAGLNLVPSETRKRIADNPLVRAGQDLEAGAEEAYPTTFTQKESLPGQIANAVGQTGSQALMTLLFRRNPAVARAVGLGTYGLVAGRQGYEDAIAHGATPEQAAEAFSQFSRIGAGAESLGLPMQALGLGPKILPKIITRLAPRNRLARVGFDTLTGSVIEGGQEAVEQLGQNVAAKTSFAPERGIMEGVPQSFVVGGAAGGIISAPLHAAGRIAHRRDETRLKNALESGRAELEGVKGAIEEIDRRADTEPTLELFRDRAALQRRQDFLTKNIALLEKRYATIQGTEQEGREPERSGAGPQVQEVGQDRVVPPAVAGEGAVPSSRNQPEQVRSVAEGQVQAPGQTAPVVEGVIPDAEKVQRQETVTTPTAGPPQPAAPSVAAPTQSVAGQPSPPSLPMSKADENWALDALQRLAETQPNTPEQESVLTEIKQRYPNYGSQDESVPIPELGPGHHRIVTQLNGLVGHGTFSQQAADTLAALSRDARDDSLFAVTLQAGQESDRTGATDVPAMMARINASLKRLESIDPSDPLYEFWKNKANHPFIVTLHEMGHIASATLTPEQLSKLESEYNRIKAEAEKAGVPFWKFYYQTLAGMGQAEVAVSVAQHFAGQGRAEAVTGFREFLGQAFAEWVMSKRVPSTELKGIFGKMHAWIKGAIQRIMGRSQEFQLGEMERIFDLMLKGGDKPLAEILTPEVTQAIRTGRSAVLDKAAAAVPEQQKPASGAPIPIDIQKPDGTVIKGEFNGYYDMRSHGKGILIAGGWTLPEEGKLTHGIISPDWKILTPIPSFEEWEKQKPAGGAFALTLEQAQAELARLRAEGDKAFKAGAKSMATQTLFLTNKFMQYLDPMLQGLDNKTLVEIMKRTGYDQIKAILERAAQVVTPEQYRDVKARVGDTPAFQTFAFEVASQWAVVRDKLRKAADAKDKMLKKWQTPAYAKKLARIDFVARRAHELELLRKYFEADVATELAKATQRLQKESKIQATAEEINRNISELEFKKQHGEAVKSAIAGMVRVMSRFRSMKQFKAPGMDALDVLYSLPNTPEAIADAIARYKEAKKQVDPDAALPNDLVLKWAMESLAKASDRRHALVALAAMNTLSDVRSGYTAYEKAITAALQRNPRKTFGTIVKQVGRFAAKEERAKAAWRDIQTRLRRWSEDAEATRISGEAAEAMLDDPELKAYEKEVFEDGSIYDRPQELQVNEDDPDNPMLIERGIPVPGGRTPKIILYGDRKQFEATQKILEDALNKIHDWMANNQNNPEVVYWAAMAEFVDNILLSHRIIAPTSFTKPFGEGRLNSPLGMLEIFADALGTRATGILKVALGNFNASYRMANNIAYEAHTKFNSVRHAAARSHEEFDHLSNQDAYEAWYRKYGNELRASWQNLGGGYRVGDPLNGGVVTPEDWDDLKFDVTTFGRMFKSVRVDIKKNRGDVVQGVTFKVKPYGSPLVLTTSSKEFSENTNPRAISDARFNLVSAWAKAVSPADKWRLIRLNWDFLNAHIKDRANIFFDRESRYEEIYKSLKDEINEDGVALSDQNVDWLIGKIASMSKDTPEEIRSVLFAEFDAMMGRLDRILNEREKAGASTMHVEGMDQKSSFNQPRGRQLAGFWLYDHGFKNSGSIAAAANGVSAYYFNRTKEALAVVLEDLTRIKRDLDARIRELTVSGVSPRAATKKAVSENKRLVELGKTYDRWEAIDKKIKWTQGIVDTFTDVMGSHGKDVTNTIENSSRVVSGMTGLALASIPTAMKNAIFAIGVNGKIYNAISGQMWSSIPGLFLRLMVTSPETIGGKTKMVAGAVPRVLGSIAAGGIRGIGQTFTRESLSKARKEWKAGKPNRAVVQLMTPLLQQIHDSMFYRIGMANELREAGYIAPSFSAERLMSILTDPSTGGAVDTTKGPAARVGWGLWGTIVEASNAAFGSAALRAADHMANLYAVSNAQQIVRDYESQLRKVWLGYKKSGINRWNLANPKDPANTITSNEAVGGLAAGITKASALERLNELFNWGSITYQEAAMRFLSELEGGNQNASILTEEEMREVANTWMEMTNKPSVLNRPLAFRQKGLVQAASQMLGWVSHDWALTMKMLSRPSNLYGGGRWAAWALIVVGLLFPLLASNIISTQLFSMLWKWVARLFHNEESNRKLIWEYQTPGDKAKAMVASAFEPVPFISYLTSQLLSETPQSRASSDPILFVQSRIIDIMDWARNVARTGDPTYGLARLSKSMMPMSAMVINRLPWVEGNVEAMDARRLLTRFGPEDLLQAKKRGSGTPSIPTGLSPIVNSMENSAMLGDDSGFIENYQHGVQWVMANRNVDEESAQKVVQQSFASRNPYRRAFTAQLTPEQREATLGRMTERERLIVTGAENRFSHAAGLLGLNVNFERQPENVLRGTSAGGGGRVAQFRPALGRARMLGMSRSRRSRLAGIRFVGQPTLRRGGLRRARRLGGLRRPRRRSRLVLG